MTFVTTTNRYVCNFLQSAMSRVVSIFGGKALHIFES